MLPFNGNVMFHFCTESLYIILYYNNCYIYILYRKWSSSPDVGLEQLHTIYTGIYPNRILKSTTIETLLKESLPVNNYQHFNKFQKCLNLEFSYLLVFIVSLLRAVCSQPSSDKHPSTASPQPPLSKPRFLTCALLRSLAGP